MPVAMSVVWDVVKNPKKSKKFQELLLKFDEVLGIDLKNYKKEEEKLPEEVQKIINERINARQEKKWAESDRLRDELVNLGYSVKDTKDGMEVKKV